MQKNFASDLFMIYIYIYLIYISIILLHLSSFFNKRIVTNIRLGYNITQTITVSSPVTFAVLQSE